MRLAIVRVSIFLFIFAALSCAPLSNQEAVQDDIWQSDSYSVELSDEGLTFYKDSEMFARILSFSFNFVEADISRVKEVSDSGVVVELLLSDTDGFSENFPSVIDITMTYTGDTFHFSTSHDSFNHITIKMADQQEHYFGLIEKLYPGNRKSPDLRGETIDVEVYALGEKDYAENYASAYSAFFMSSAGYGSFFDTFAKGRYQFAKEGVTEIYHQSDSLDWYLFYGPTGDAIHRSYYEVIGDPKSVPIWALGPVVWRDHNGGGKEQILDDLEKYTDMKIPLTATFVDRPYSDGGHEWSKMNFTEKFSNPEEWIGTIQNHFGLEFMSWVGPLTFGDQDFPGLLPNYKTYIDLTDPEALADFEKRLNQHQYSVGIKGHKMDRADENFPVTALWNDPVSESESRNKYVYLYSKVIHEFLENAHGEDQFNFARAAFHRTQPYLSAVWGGDVRPNWIGMSSNQANAMRSSFMGFPVWGTDTGGYLGDGFIDEKLYARWLQWGAWNGMFEVKIDGAGGSGKDRAPWRYSQALQDVYRQVSEWRMQLIPYSYSMANTSSKNGVLMKPMAYLYPEDDNTYDIWDQYIFGNAFLVAPLFSADDTREIYLPKGTWYDFNNLSVSYQGPERIERTYGFSDTPVFIKANSIYVTGDIYRGNSKHWKENEAEQSSLSIHLFPGDDGDKTEFTYIDYLDNDKVKSMVLKQEADELLFSSPALTIPSTLEIKVDFEPESVNLNGESVAYQFSDVEKRVSVPVEAQSAIELTVQ